LRFHRIFTEINLGKIESSRRKEKTTRREEEKSRRGLRIFNEFSEPK
jgi:hypothetical protein